MLNLLRWIFISVAILDIQANAASLPENIDTSLSVRGAVWSGDRFLSDTDNLSTLDAWGKIDVDLEEKGQIVGQAFAQTIVSPELTASVSDEQNNARIRELYWKVNGDAWSMRIGRQLIALGRADGLNPTDNLSPKHFTLLTPEDSDQRFGNDAVNLGYQVGDHTFSAIWFPSAASNIIPLEAHPAITYVKRPAPEENQYALKWETLGSNFDSSVSWFDGYDPMPDLSVANLSPEGIVVAQSNNKFRVLGADLSYPHGNKVWRFEAAYSDTQSAGPNDFTRKKSRVWFVGGPEWTLDGGLTLNLQLSLQHIYDHADPEELSQPFQDVAWRQLALSNQTEPNQQGITWRIAKTGFNDSLLLETTGVTFWPNANGLSRSKINYAISDALHIQAGYEAYFGSGHSFFEQLKPNNIVYLQLRYMTAH
ncbi:MAG TPA: hypothetical protein VL995_21460 [Cellvibrio sp.]|nr:hypothetical protein [Cellvibrio sp.]